MNHYAHYALSKAGVAMLTRALAVELGPKIRVNAIAPGVVAPMEEYPDFARDFQLKRTPLGREGTPEDVAQAVLYLASAPFVTGHVLAIDGGRSATL